MAIEIDQVFININQHQYRGSIPILNNKYWYCDMPNRDRDAATDSDRVLLAHDRRILIRQVFTFKLLPKSSVIFLGGESQ